MKVVWMPYEEKIDERGNTIEAWGTIINNYKCLFAVLASPPIFDTHTIMYEKYHVPKKIIEPNYFKFYRHEMYLTLDELIKRQHMAMTELELLAQGKLP